MIPAPAASELSRVAAVVAAVRRSRALWLGLVGIGGLLALFAMAIWMPGAWFRAPGSMAPMLILTAGVCVAGGIGAAIGRSLRAHRISVVAEELEQAAGLGRGDVLGALELGSISRGSSALAALQRARVAAALGNRSLPELLPLSWRRLRSLRVRAIQLGAVAIVALGAGLALGPEGGGDAAEALGRPWDVTFPPAPPPLQVHAESSQIVRGGRLPVRVAAAGRQRVVLASRGTGEVTRRQTLEVTAGWAAGSVGPVETATRFWAEDDRRASADTLLVIPLDPLMLIDAGLEIVYPDYLDRPAETLARLPASLAVPEGAVVRARGRFNHPIRRAALLIEGDAGVDTVELRPRGAAVEGGFGPTDDGRIRWVFDPSGPVPGKREPAPIDLTVLPDGRPEISIVYPGQDQTVGMDGTLPLVIEARDDHYVVDVRLVWWRVSAAGIRDDATSLRVDAGRRERSVVVRHSLDGEVRRLLPGDLLAYYASARDANPRGLASTTDTFRVRVADLTEIRAEAAARTEALAEAGRDLAERSTELASEARDARLRWGGSERDPAASGSDPGDETGFGSTQTGRAILDEARALEADLERQVGELQAMRRGAERSALGDPSLGDQLARLEELFQEALDAGLRERIGELERALQRLSGDDLRRAAGDLANETAELRDRLERAVDLMERVATEQSLKSARDRARDLADRQDQLVARGAESDGWSAAEGELAGQAGELEAGTEALAERLQSTGADDAARGTREASGSLGDAVNELGQAVQERRGRDPTEDSAAGERADAAAADLRAAAESLEAATESLVADWRQEALAAVESAMTQSLDLGREQARLVERLRSGDSAADLASAQSALREGLDNVSQSLAEAGGKTALLDRRSGSAASRAADGMDALGESLTTGGASRDEAIREGEDAVAALSDLAGSLMASRRAMAEAASATGVEEALERLARMGRRQLALNGETADLFLALTQGGRSADRLREMAERQSNLARELELLAREPAARELTARPEELAREAEDVARRLSDEQLDREVLARQERLFRRLLDAGRSLEREDPDTSRRESATARALPPATIPGTDARLLQGPRYPYPEEADLADLSATQRRLVYEYFDRLNRAPPGTDDGDEDGP